MEDMKCLAGVPSAPLVVNTSVQYPRFLLHTIQPRPAAITPRPPLPTVKIEDTPPLVLWKFRETGKTLIIWSELVSTPPPLSPPPSQPVQLSPFLQSTTGIYSTGNVSQLADELTQFLKLWAVELEDSFDIGQETEGMTTPTGLITRTRSSNPGTLKQVQKELLKVRMLANLQTEDSQSYVHMNTRYVMSPIPSKSPSSGRSTSLNKHRPAETDQSHSNFRIRPHRLILETLKDARNIEREATPKPLQFQEFQSRFELNRRTKVILEEAHTPTETSTRSLSFYRSSRQLELQNTDSARRFWLRRRRPVEVDHTSKVEAWIRSLHSMMDTEGTGTVTGEVVVGQLLALGLARNPEDVIQALAAIYGQSDIVKMRLTLDDLLSLIKIDRETNKFLTFLCRRAVESKRNRSLSPSKPHLEVAWKTESLTLSDYFLQVKTLWSLLGKKSVSKRQICEFLCNFQLFSTITEAKKSLKFIKETLDFSEFQRIFSKSILIGSLFSLALKLNPINLALSSKMQISQYQRRLLLAGLQGNSKEIEKEDGQATLNALEKFDFLVKKKGNMQESRRYSALLA